MTNGLRARLREQSSAPAVSGEWRSIQLCLDEDSREFFNIGVLFCYGRTVEVRMLDSFDRLRCLFDNRVNQNDLARTLHDIESVLIKSEGAIPESLGSNIRLGAPLYAAGATAECVVDEFFSDIVTLARPRPQNSPTVFRYRSTPKLRNTVLDHLRESLPMVADRLIQKERYLLRLRTGNRIELDIPLVGSDATGHIVSAWYKSPLVVENSLLQASADLNLVRSNTDRQKAVVSVLVPDASSGLSKAEFNKLDMATSKQLDRVRATGIDVIQANNTQALAAETVRWWERQAC